MPKKQRLGSADFKIIAAARFRREHGALFTLSHGTLLGQKEIVPKVACIVSKKVSTKAVDRNRIKRRCYAAVREGIKNIAKPVALIFYAKRSAKDASYADIRKDITALMEGMHRSFLAKS